eukprot:TRINITY_DN68127_c9_g1_i1.p3 TRINITY_DN68127_c9_g1~~TRINITY_DN68127_c9_g1_i1.p3  ORF type:complete len:151 (-),score=8.73 TRINITY_DN68127_c9_g1_i1:191-643(-)
MVNDESTPNTHRHTGWDDPGQQVTPIGRAWVPLQWPWYWSWCACIPAVFRNFRKGVPTRPETVGTSQQVHASVDAMGTSAGTFARTVSVCEESDVDCSAVDRDQFVVKRPAVFSAWCIYGTIGCTTGSVSDENEIFRTVTLVTGPACVGK